MVTEKKKHRTIAVVTVQDKRFLTQTLFNSTVVYNIAEEKAIGIARWVGRVSAYKPCFFTSNGEEDRGTGGRYIEKTVGI